MAFELGYALNASKAFGRNIVFALKQVLSKHLQNDDVVVLTGFGRFHLKRVAGKSLRNPANGRRYDVPPHTCPAFRPAEALRRKCFDISNLKSEISNAPRRRRRA